MPLPLQIREVDISDASDFDVIERQAALQVHCTGLGFKIGPAEVACRGVKPDAELRPTFRGGKLMCTYPRSILSCRALTLLSGRNPTTMG